MDLYVLRLAEDGAAVRNGKMRVRKSRLFVSCFSLLYLCIDMSSLHTIRAEMINQVFRIIRLQTSLMQILIHIQTYIKCTKWAYGPTP